MVWRPWVIISFGIVAVLLNLVLIVQEDLPAVSVAPEVKKIIEPLRTLTYIPANRRQNLVEMGFDDELADAAAKEMGRLQTQREKWMKILSQQSTDLTVALCPSERLPQPYAMLEWLVYEDAGTRYVVSPVRVTVLERNPWYAQSGIANALYEQYERTEDRKREATLMAVSSLMLGREMDALEGRSPWSRGALGSWGFRRLQGQEARVRQMAIEYFALMHYLTELANQREGICQS